MVEAKRGRKRSGNTTIGELVGTAGLRGYGFNAVRRNDRFASEPAVPKNQLLTRSGIGCAVGRLG
ncbi:hypothetical protein LJR220_000005 [Bradyrhizobium sp. LjRoot220]|uniref:hypothetical protein n=1 Tax=Bradyrhizobium sp. LjRoot220 TaxID=3342284 RepID=UPI003ED0DDAE